MTRAEVATLKGALHSYIAELAAEADRAEMELTVARGLLGRASSAIDSSLHVRDEDMMPDALWPGDVMRVQTALLQSWVASAGTSATVVVTQIIAEPDGTKTVIVGAAGP